MSAKHGPGPDRRKLVHVADDHQGRMVRHGRQEPVHQDDVHHG